MTYFEDLTALTGEAAGVSNSDPCVGPLAPGNSDSQTALDELDASQVSCRGVISQREAHSLQHVCAKYRVPQHSMMS
jgi:hypothetical protein